MAHYACGPFALEGGYPMLAMINCWAGSTFVGRFVFWNKGEVQHSDLAADPAEGFYLDYEIDKYGEIIGTLRYEKPLHVWISYNESTLHMHGSRNYYNIAAAYIGTQAEPVGEQEGIPSFNIKFPPT